MLDGRRIHRSKVEPLHNTVDFRCVLGPHHHIHHTVCGFLFAAQGAIDNAVTLGFGGKLFQVFFRNSEYLEFLAAFQHGGETLAALDLVLIPIFQHRINGGGNVFGSGAGEL